MRILEVREKSIQLSGNVSNAVVSFEDHTVSLVALVSDQQSNGRPLIGYGFNSIGRFGQSGIIRERMTPRLIGADPEQLFADDGLFSPESITRIAMQNEKPGGHGDRAGAMAAIELAVWDLNAKINDEPACETIARVFHNNIDNYHAKVYAAGGYYYAEDSLDRLKTELTGYQEQGYKAFKMKIGGASLDDDLQRIDAAIEIAGSGQNIAVDANGRFDQHQALTYARELAPRRLRWYEEPGDPLDFALNCAVTSNYEGAVATGENLFSHQDVRNLARYGGMRAGVDLFQMDAGLSYGLTEYARMIETLESQGFDRGQCHPHGGHLINLHIAIALSLGGCEAYPGVFQPFGGYSSACQVENGFVACSDAPGFGLEQKSELAPYLRQLAGAS